jgi:hypothetical protein
MPISMDLGFREKICASGFVDLSDK